MDHTLKFIKELCKSLSIKNVRPSSRPEPVLEFCVSCLVPTSTERLLVAASNSQYASSVTLLRSHHQTRQVFAVIINKRCTTITNLFSSNNT